MSYKGKFTLPIVRSAGGASLTAANCRLADIHLITTSGGAGAVTLPRTTTVPIGKVFTFVGDVGGANAIVLTADATVPDTINGVNGTVTTTGSISAAEISVTRNPKVVTDWIVLSN
jgi:hypothetical protein